MKTDLNCNPPVGAADKNFRNILLVLIARFGDYIVTTPFLDALRKKYPQARITLVTSGKAEDLARRNPNLDEVVIFNGWHHLSDTLKVLNLPRKKIDLAIDLNTAYSRTSIGIMLLSRAPVRLGLEKKAPAGVYTAMTAQNTETEHFLDKYVRLAASLGFTPRPEMKIHLSPDIMREAERIFKRLDLSADTIKIAIHAGNFKKFESRWPEEKFVEFTKGLTNNPRLEVFYLVGLGEETETSEKILKFLPGVKFIPPEPAALTAALLKQADILVCNSTGTLHLAAAAGVPTFSFNRPYTEKCWKPRGKSHFHITSASAASCRDIKVADALAAFDLTIEKLFPAKTKKADIGK